MTTATISPQADEQLAELRDRLWSAIQERDSKAKKQPNGSLSFRCVAHEDSSPSAWIRDFGWGCAGCNARGNLKDLAERIGVEVPWTGGSGYTVEDYASEKGLSLQNLSRWGVDTAEGKFSLFVAIPYRNPDGSHFRSQARGRNGRKWWHDDGAGISIYGLDLLAKARLDLPVLIVEGASDCHAAWTHKVLAVGIPGATTWRSEWAAHFAGRPVFIFQEPGDAGAQMVRTIAADLPDARIIRSDGLAKDLADLHRHDPTGFAAKLQAAMDAAQPLSEKEDAPPWVEQPRPIPSGLPPVEPFNSLLLPDSLRPWVSDIAERMQCPPEFAAVAVMVALASVVGRRVGIRPKRQDDWTVVANLWGAVIGRPGLMKTPPVQEVLNPLRRLEIQAKEAYEEAIRQFNDEQELRAIQKDVRKAKAKERLKKGADFKSVAQGWGDEEEPRPPVRARYVVNDTTVEKLGEILEDNPNGVLAFRDELIGLLRSLDKEGHESARAFYLEAWAGNGRFTYDRIGRGTRDIEAATVSVLGCIQPGPPRPAP